MGFVETPWHLVLLALIALLLFGGKRLPEMGRSLGHGMREFKDAVTGNSPAPPSEPEPTAVGELPPAEPTVTHTAAPPADRETV